MTWQMVRDLHRAGFTIGSHTRTHAWLANESAEKSAEEIAGSKRDLDVFVACARELVHLITELAPRLS